MLLAAQNQHWPERAPSKPQACQVTPSEMALCRTAHALALLLHLKAKHPIGPFPIVAETIGHEMAPCRLSHNTVRTALSLLIDAGLVECLDACPIPRTITRGRPITHLYRLKPSGTPNA